MINKLKRLIKNTGKAFLAIGIAFAITACTASKERAASTDAKVKSNLEGAENAMEMSTKPGETVSVDTVTMSDDLYLGHDSIMLEYLNPLPKDFETDYGITLTSKEKTGIFGLANQITYLTGIQVKVLDITDAIKAKKINVSYSGPLSGLLNMVSNELGVSWEYTGNVINIFSTRTKIFSLYTLATETKLSSKIKGDSKGDSTITTDVNLENWTDIENTIKSMIAGEAAASVNISRPTGTVTVTASLPKLRTIEKYINSINRRFTRQVAIHIKIVQVSLEDSDSMGLDLNAVFKSASGIQIASGSGGQTSGSTGDGTTTASTTNSSNGNGDLSFTILNTTGALNALAGSEAAVQALSKQGRVSYVTNTTLLTRNGRVFPFNMLQEFKYVASMATSTENTTATTDVRTESESTGLSIQILPNILDNGRLLLMFGLTLRELIELTPADSTGKNLIMLPKIDNRSFLNELILQSGQTVVLTGFEKNVNKNNDVGLGNPDFKALGGSRETSSTKEVLVVILTPQILKSSMHPDKRAGSNYGISEVTE